MGEEWDLWQLQGNWESCYWVIQGGGERAYSVGLGCDRCGMWKWRGIRKVEQIIMEGNRIRKRGRDNTKINRLKMEEGCGCFERERNLYQFVY
jgi:hypothetical protein